MKKQTHYIQKQKVMLDFMTEENARQWNESFSDFYRNDIIPPLSALLDKYIPEDQTYVIDRLEINLGNVQIDKFRAAFLKETEEALERIFKKGTRSGYHISNDTTHAKDSDWQESRQSQQKSWQDISEQEEHVRLIDKKQHLLENFYHFLDHGILPWSSTITRVAEMETGIRDEIGLANLAAYPGFQKRMYIASARQRLYFQFTRPFVNEIFNLIFGPELTVLTSLKEDLDRCLIDLAKNTSTREKIKQELSDAVWNWIITDIPFDTGEWPAHFVNSAIKNLSTQLKPSSEESILRAILEEKSSSSGLAAQVNALLTSIDISRKQESQVPDEVPQDESKTYRRNQYDLNKSDSKKEQQKETRNYESNQDPDKDTDRRALDYEKAGEETDEERIDGKKVRRSANGDEELEKKSAVKEPERRTGDSKSLDTGDNNTQKPSELEKAGGITSVEIHSKRTGEIRKGRKKRKSINTEKDRTSESEDVTPPYDAGVGKKEQPVQLRELEEYYLRNAGIILCWPYLKRLFNQLEYLRDDTFKEPGYQQRAIHLLGYVGSGVDKCEEHALVLAKFLCAWPLQMPIFRELELTDEEKNNADQMLKSLITHWSVLKNTSVEGLRQSFFVRDGKLCKENRQWRLIVEQKSYDMLLDRLPYTVTIIKLPWMSDMLKVDWA